MPPRKDKHAETLLRRDAIFSLSRHYTANAQLCSARCLPLHATCCSPRRPPTHAAAHYARTPSAFCAAVQ